MFIAITLVSLILGFSIYYFDLSLIWTLICSFLLLSYSVFLIIPAMKNLSNSGVFRCELSEHEFIQSFPFESCDDSFRLQLADIKQIELDHGCGGEYSSYRRWYIHTSETRYMISPLFGNPHDQFGEALLKQLPHIKTIDA